MGAAAGAVALGVGLGLAWPRLGATWSRPGAIVDADFAGDRYVFAGRNHASKAAFLVDIGGNEAADGFTIGPYAIPGAPEKVMNGDFSAGTAGWTGHRSGTIGVAAGICTLTGNGGNIPGFAQAVSLQKGHAYQFQGRQRKSHTPTPSWSVSSNSDLGGVNACHLPDSGTGMHDVASTFSADAQTMYVGGRQVQNPSNGTSEYEDASIVEVLPFAGFEQEGFAAQISGVTPATASGDKVIFEASCGGRDGDPALDVSLHERNRARLVWDGSRHLRLTVTAHGIEQANLDLGLVEVSTAFDVLFSVRANEVHAAIEGGPVLVDTVGDLPGLAKIYLMRQNAPGSTFDGMLGRVTLFPTAWSEAEFLERQAARSSIAAWGDSLTAGAGASSAMAQYPAVAAAAYNPHRSIFNLGIGGQTSTAIAARQGGRQIAVTVAGDEVPASGAIAATAKSINVLFDSGSFAGTQKGWLAGVYGTMSTDAAGDWTFTRQSPGSAVACPAGSQFLPEFAVKLRARTQWLWLGRNGAQAGYTIEQDIAAASAWLGHGRYLVGAILTHTSDSPAGVAAIRARNSALAAVYGSRFVDVYAALAAANDGSPADLDDVANGYTPASLRTDQIHLNDAGYAVVAAAFKARNDAMGW